jgi:hypothetical protein
MLPDVTMPVGHSGSVRLQRADRIDADGAAGGTCTRH